MYIIAGLGNPGNPYVGTRHNIGFDVIDRLASQYEIPVNAMKHRALEGKGWIGKEKVLLVKPMTYMNLSGESIRAVLDFYKEDVSRLLVIYDDVSLPMGQLRLRKKGSAGGHNGIKSIISHLGSDTFNRIKVGVGEKPEKMDLADFVLAHYTQEELPQVKAGVVRSCEAVADFLEYGMDWSMNQYNGKTAEG